MAQAIEAVIGTDGVVRLLEPLTLKSSRRAVVVLLPDLSDEYAAARAAGDTPEAKASRAAALADYRANGGLSTPEAIQYFLSLIGEGGGK